MGAFQFNRAGLQKHGRWLALLLLAAVPCVLAVLQLGRVHDDEVFQFLEPALFRARGYGILSWEWQQGLRNWAIPGLLSLLLKAGDALGVTSPRVDRALVALPQLALNLWALAAVRRYALGRLQPRHAWAVVLLVALYGPWLAFAGRTLGEAYSAALLLVALEALDRAERPFVGGLWGGLALGLAVVARYGSLVFVGLALAVLAGRRAWRMLGGACLAGGLVALALGALDFATWGAPFHSLTAYVRFNVMGEGAASTFGAEPWTFYLPLLAKAVPLWAWAGPVAALRWGRLRPALGLVWAVGYVVAISATGHKEPRFLYPALVLLTVEGAVGLFWALERWQPARLPAAAWGAAGVVALGLALAPYLLFEPQRGDQFRAVVAATRGKDATGLLLVNEGVWGSPGYFYMGKNILFGVCDWPSARCTYALRDPRINRVSTYEGAGLPEMMAMGFRVVEQVGDATWLAR